VWSVRGVVKRTLNIGFDLKWEATDIRCGMVVKTMFGVYGSLRLSV
jgi:hypothetical protein